MRKLFALTLAAVFSSVVPSFAKNDCPAITVPAYFPKDSSSDWNAILRNSFARSRTDVVIVAPCATIQPDGTCVRSNDTAVPEYTNVINRFRSLGIRPIGYIWTNYGNRRYQDVIREIDNYRRLYNVDGFFIDGVYSGAVNNGKFNYYRAISYHIRNGVGGYVLLNPGVFPTEERYFWLADRIVTFQGTYARYIAAQPPVPSWGVRIPSSKIMNLVHTMPVTSAAISRALLTASDRNVGAVYFTDRPGSLPTDNPWLHISRAWSATLVQLSRQCIRR